MNCRIKRLVHENCLVLVSPILLVLIILAVILYLNDVDWQIMVTVVGSLISFVYFIQKQQLEEAKFINELFIRYNQKYAGLNNELRILEENKQGFKELQPDERETLNKYFNLCGEEYLFYRRGYIYPEVWRAWVAGMKFYYDNERIKQLWKEELRSPSYYGFDLEKEIKRIAKS